MSIFPFALLALFTAPHLWAQASRPDAIQIVRSVVSSELHAAQTDHSAWTYRDHDTTASKNLVSRVVETPHGDLQRVIERNGRPLSSADDDAEKARARKYVADIAAQAKARKNGEHDGAQATALLKMLPDAFLWKLVSESPGEVELSYEPKSAFDPPNMEARVMSSMGGTMIVAREANRIRTLRGALSNDVKIGLGVLGKLNQGGTFDIERREVAPGRWQITETHVHIGGHALLFKTIGQQEDEVKTDWKSSTAENLADAARMLGVSR